MKNVKSKIVSTALAASVVLAGLPALHSDAASARKGFDSKKVGGKVVISTFADAVSLTPLNSSDSASADITSLVYDGLLTINKSGAVVPALATSWKKSGLTYTFTIRKGVKWHDGKPFTAKDVKFSYDMFMNPKAENNYASLFDAVKSTKLINDYSFQITLKEKDVLFLENTVASAPIMPKHQFPKGVEDYNNNNKIHRNPIGTGPFKFKEWKSNERIVVTANKSYFEGRPYLNEVITKVLPDANVEALNLIKGSVDYVESLTPKLLAQVKKDKDTTTKSYDQGRFDFIGFNSAAKPWNNEKFREALAYGLDRKSIVSKIQLGRAYQGSGPMHPKIPQNNDGVKALPYDVKKAAALLKEIGYEKRGNTLYDKDGKAVKLEFAYNNGNKTREAVALLAQQNWAKLGIKVTPRAYEWSIFLEKYAAGELDCFALGWGGYDANVDHYQFFHSSGIPSKANPSLSNRNRVDDKTIDKLLEQYKQEESREKRIKIYEQLHKYMSDHEILIWTYHPKLTMGYDEDLGGVEASISNDKFSIIDWYWKDAKKRK